MASAGFPIWHLIRVGYAETFRNFSKVLKLAWGPFLLALGAAYLVDVAYDFTRPAGMLDGPHFGAWTVPILYARMIIVECCLAIFALAMFRCRLLGWSDRTDHVRLALGRRELVFLGAGLLAFAIHIALWSYFIAARTFHSLAHIYGSIELLSMLVYLAILFVFAKLCFALAAASMSPEVAVKGAWRLRLVDWAVLVVVLTGTVGPFTILRIIPRYLSYFSGSLEDDAFRLTIDLFGIDAAVLLHTLVSHAISLTLSFLGIAVAVTAVSSAFQARETKRQHAT